MRYHIMYSDRLVLKDGGVVKYDDVVLHEPTHEYDIGTREKMGLSKNPRMNDECLEDFMQGRFVVILETGDTYFKGEQKYAER